MSTSIVFVLEQRHRNLSERIGAAAALTVTSSLTSVLAGVIVLQLRTKCFHWHVVGPNFRQLHGLFDEQSDELSSIADEMAERVRAFGCPTISAIGDVVRLRAVNARPSVPPDANAMLSELHRGNLELSDELLGLRETCEEHGDFVTVGLIESWLESSDRRQWMLSASMSHPEPYA